VAAMVDKLTALCDLAGWADGGWAMPPAATAATARLCKAAAALIERLAAQLRESEEVCRASDQKEFPATYRAWEKKWVAQGAELADMTAERDDAFARALEFRLTELDAVRAERNAALARAEAAEPDALRWRECVGHADGTGCGFPAGHRGEWLVVSRPDGQIITGATPNEIVDAAIAKGAP